MLQNYYKSQPAKVETRDNHFYRRDLKVGALKMSRIIAFFTGLYVKNTETVMNMSYSRSIIYNFLSVRTIQLENNQWIVQAFIN